MNQVGLVLIVGVLAGAAGAFGVHALMGDGDSGPPSAPDLGAIEARLDRLEAAIGRLPSEPTLRGTAPKSQGAVLTEGGIEALAEQVGKRLEPALAERVEAGIERAMKAREEALVAELAAEDVEKKKVTLAEAAAELGLSADEEAAVRRITAEGTEELFKLLAGKDMTVEDVKRDFEEARHDAKKRAGLLTKYMPRAMADLGGLVKLGLDYDKKLKDAIGQEKADKLESEYEIEELDPYGIEDLFEGFE